MNDDASASPTILNPDCPMRVMGIDLASGPDHHAILMVLGTKPAELPPVSSIYQRFVAGGEMEAVVSWADGSGMVLRGEDAKALFARVKSGKCVHDYLELLTSDVSSRNANGLADSEKPEGHPLGTQTTEATA